MLRRLGTSAVASACAAATAAAASPAPSTARAAAVAGERLLRDGAWAVSNPQDAVGPRMAATWATSASASGGGSGVTLSSGSSWSRGFASASTSGVDASETLTIDASVPQRIKQLQADTSGSTVLLRIEVEGGGCSGFNYKFDLDDKVNDDDMIFEQDGCRVVCDKTSFEFLKGSKIEFEESLMRSAFVVSANPNAEATCGCGTSFAFKM